MSQYGWAGPTLVGIEVIDLRGRGGPCGPAPRRARASGSLPGNGARTSPPGLRIRRGSSGTARIGAAGSLETASRKARRPAVELGQPPAADQWRLRADGVQLPDDRGGDRAYRRLEQSPMSGVPARAFWYQAMAGGAGALRPLRRRTPGGKEGLDIPDVLNVDQGRDHRQAGCSNQAVRTNRNTTAPA